MNDFRGAESVTIQAPEAQSIHASAILVPDFEKSPYVDWAVVIAGAVVALAVSFVLMTFGASAGLSAVSPWTVTRSTVTAVSWGAILWLILSHIWSFSLGGYLAARMRHRRKGASPLEVEFRDGAHGALVWALSVTVGAIIAVLVAALATHGGLAMRVAGGADPASAASDTLMRTAAAATPVEIDRLLTRSSGPSGIAPADRAFLIQVVAARAGISPPEAERRIDQTAMALKIEVEHARKVAVFAGFITAATLLVGAAAAWWGGTVGGKHRDEGTLWAGLGGNIPLANVWEK